MDGYIGEIRPFALSFAPRNWAFCAGQMLIIRSNQALFSLLGIQFGGDGITNFALPDLRGRAIVGSTAFQFTQSPIAYPTGQASGSETVVLNETQMPAHNHTVGATAATANTAGPKAAYFATPGKSKTNPVIAIYTQDTSAKVALRTSSVSIHGEGTHQNMQPFGVVNFCICLTGMYPNRD